MKGLSRSFPVMISLAFVLGPTPSLVPASSLPPLVFVANEGQVDARADYYIAGRDRAVFFRPGGISISLTGPASSENGPRDVGARDTDVRRWTVEQEFVGADGSVRPEGEDRARAVLSFFKGEPEDWRVGIPTYSRLAYRNLWPGIDLVYSSESDRLKYEFVVRPGSDPAAIKLRYKGATTVTLRGDGRVEVGTPVGSFEDAVPVAYQEKEGRSSSTAATSAAAWKTRGQASPSTERETPTSRAGLILSISRRLSAPG